MRFPRPAFLTGLLLPACAVALAGAIPATTAHAEVHRCTAPNGESIYTDKSCSAIGARIITFDCSGSARIAS